MFTAATNTQLHGHVFQSQLSTTCFDITAIIMELTPILQKLTVIFSNTGVSSMMMAVMSKHVAANWLRQ